MFRLSTIVQFFACLAAVSCGGESTAPSSDLRAAGMDSNAESIDAAGADTDAATSFEGDAGGSTVGCEDFWLYMNQPDCVVKGSGCVDMRCMAAGGQWYCHALMAAY